MGRGDGSPVDVGESIIGVEPAGRTVFVVAEDDGDIVEGSGSVIPCCFVTAEQGRGDAAFSGTWGGSRYIPLVDVGLSVTPLSGVGGIQPGGTIAAFRKIGEFDAVWNTGAILGLDPRVKARSLKATRTADDGALGIGCTDDAVIVVAEAAAGVVGALDFGVVGADFGGAGIKRSEEPAGPLRATSPADAGALGVGGTRDAVVVVAEATARVRGTCNGGIV